MLSSWDVKSPVARVLGEAGPGCMWVVRPQSQPLSQWDVWGKPQSPEQKAAVLHLVPLTNTSTVEKGICQRRQSTVLFNQGLCGPSEPTATQSVQDGRGQGSRRIWWPPGKVWGAKGSMLPAWPGSQSGVSSVAPGSGRGGPTVWRLWGVSMEVDHPAYSSIPTEQESGPRAGR